MAYEVTRKVILTGVGAIGSKIVITGAPSEPKAVIFKFAGNVGAADGVTGQDMRQGTGFAAKRLGVITEGVCGTSALDGAATTDTHRWLRDDAVIEVRDAAGVDNGRAFIASFDPGGITLEIASVFNQSYAVEVIMLGGSTPTDFEIKSFFLPIVNGNFDVTPWSFQPDCILMTSEFDLDPILPDDHNGGVNGLGVCVSSTQQGYLSHRDQRAVPTTDSQTSCLQGAECLAEVRSTNPDARYALVTFIANGARFNMIEFQNADRVIGLAMKGGDYTIAEMLTETDTVTDIDVTGLPSKPAGGIVISGFRAEDAINTQQADFRQSVGFWDGVSQGVQAAYGENGVGTSNVATGQRSDAVYQSINNTPAEDGAMRFISRGATSAKFKMAVADPSQRFTFGLFFGPAAAIPPVIGDGVVTDPTVVTSPTLVT